MGTVEWERKGCSGTSTGSSAKPASGNRGVSPGFGPFGVFHPAVSRPEYIFSVSFCGILFPLLFVHFTSFLDSSFNLFHKMKS